MAKYHVDSTGKIYLCSNKRDDCQYGPLNEHIEAECLFSASILNAFDLEKKLAEAVKLANKESIYWKEPGFDSLSPRDKYLIAKNYLKENYSILSKHSSDELEASIRFHRDSYAAVLKNTSKPEIISSLVANAEDFFEYENLLLNKNLNQLQFEKIAESFPAQYVPLGLWKYIENSSNISAVREKFLYMNKDEKLSMTNEETISALTLLALIHDPDEEIVHRIMSTDHGLTFVKYIEFNKDQDFCTEYVTYANSKVLNCGYPILDMLKRKNIETQKIIAERTQDINVLSRALTLSNEVALIAAKNPYINNPFIISSFINSRLSNVEVLRELASNPNLSSEMLVSLFKQSDIFVKANVIKNPNTPKELIDSAKINEDAQVVQQAIKEVTYRNFLS